MCPKINEKIMKKSYFRGFYSRWDIIIILARLCSGFHLELMKNAHENDIRFLLEF